MTEGGNSRLGRTRAISGSMILKQNRVPARARSISGDKDGLY